MVQKIYSKLHPVPCANTHHDVTDMLNHGMVENTKTWISWERNITFLQNKKILNLCLRWHILRSYCFVVEVTFKNILKIVLLLHENVSWNQLSFCLYDGQLLVTFHQGSKVQVSTCDFTVLAFPLRKFHMLSTGYCFFMKFCQNVSKGYKLKMKKFQVSYFSEKKILKKKSTDCVTLPTPVH